MRSTTSLVLVLLLIFACSPAISVYNDFDHEMDISVYRTYDWKVTTGIESNQNPMYYNELNDKRIKTAVNNALENKGYKKMSEAPALLLHYHIIVEDRSVVTMDPNEHQFSPYWMRPEMNTFQYKEGTLIIDLMDARTNDLVWRGWAVTVLEDPRPKNIEKKLTMTIDRIFDPLPQLEPESETEY